MAEPNVLDNEELYDVIKLGGVTSPGGVTLSGHDLVIGWDIKEGSGQKGAKMTRKSQKPIEFTATFSLLRDVARGIDDYANWSAFETIIKSTVAGKEPRALDIYHPDLAEREIKSVVLGTLGGRTYDGKGGSKIAVKFLEYRPPQKSGGSPVGAKTKKSPKADPNAERKAELAATRGEYQRTPWG